MKSKLKPRTYTLQEAFGPGFPSEIKVEGFEKSECRFVPRPDLHWRWDRTLLRDLCVWWQDGDGDPCHLFGPTGAGKSSAIRNFCAALCIPMYEKTLVQTVEFDQLVTVVDLVDGSTVTSYGHLPLAMGAEGWPGIFVPNEIDRADPNTVIGLNEVLQGQPLTVHLGGLDAVDPDPTFRVASTGNSAMGGDMIGQYGTVKQQDMSTADRFDYFKVSYPEPAFEEEILELAVPALDPRVRTKMIEVANLIRQAFMGESTAAHALPLTMSTRVLKKWARRTYSYRLAQSASLNPVAYALDRALLYRADGMPEVRRAVLELVRGVMGDAFGQFT